MLPDQLACNKNQSLNNCMSCMLTQHAKCLLLFVFSDRYRPLFKSVLKSRRVTRPNWNINYARLMNNALAFQIRRNVDEYSEVKRFAFLEINSIAQVEFSSSKSIRDQFASVNNIRVK